LNIKETVDKIKAVKAAEKRIPFTIALKAKTIARIEEIARGSGLSLSAIASEILEMGLSVGESVEVLGEQMQGFADKIIAANQTLTKAKKSEFRKAVKKTFPIRKKINRGGRR